MAWAQTSVTLGEGIGVTTGFRWDTGTIDTGTPYSSGDFYLSFGSSGEVPKFLATTTGQRAIVDLGDLGSVPLTGITPPSVAGYSRQGVVAVAGHTYAALTRFGDTWDYSVFKVTDVQNNGSVTLDYVLTNLPAPNRTLNVAIDTTINDAGGIGSVSIDAGRTFTANLVGASPPFLSGNISGAGALNISKTGANSIWTLLGDATHTGGTTVQPDVLFHIGDYSDPATTGSISGNIVNNGTVTFNRRDGVAFTGSISGTGWVRRNVSGDISFTGSNTYSGPTIIGAGRLIADAVNTLSPNSVHAIATGATLQLNYDQVIGGLNLGGSINLADAVTLTLAPASGPVFSGIIQGNGSLVISGPGVQILSSDTTFTGTTTVTGGVLQLGFGGTTGSVAGPLIVSGNGGLAINRSDNFTLGIGITGTGGLTKSGAGALTLTGANTYSFTTTLSAGTLIAGATDALSANSTHSLSTGTTLQLDYNQTVRALASSGTVNMANGSVLTIGNGAGQNFSGVIQGDGSLIKSGTGTQILSGNNTFTGTTTVTGGTLQLGNGGTTGSVAGGLSVSGAGSLAVNRSDNLTMGIGITGTGGLTKSGAGTLTLTGANTYSGPTTLVAGTLTTGASNTLSANSLHSVGSGTTLYVDYSQSVAGVSSNGTVNLANNSVLTIGNAAGNNFSGVIQGNGSLIKSGTGTQILSSNITFTGTTTVTGGTLQLGNGGTTGSVAGGLTVSGAGWLTVNRSDNLTLDLAMSGTGNLIKAGTGTVTLTGSLTHTGQTNVSQGTLATGAPNVLSASGSINVTGASGTLEINHDQTVKSFSGAGSTVLASGATLTIQGNTPAGTNVSTSYTGVISGGGGLAVNDHSLNIRSVSTYSGTTTLTGGDTTLRIGNPGTATDSASILNTIITVSDGADLTGNGSVGDVIVNSGGLLGPGFSGTGTLTATNMTWNPGGVLRFQIYDATGTAGTRTGWDLLSVSGALAINATITTPFVIALESLATGPVEGSVAAGAAANFAEANFYTWKLAATTQGITGFDPLAFSMITGGIAGQTGTFTNPIAGSFSLSQSGNDLYLNYTPAAIPEPSTYVGILGLSALGLAAFRRRITGRQSPPKTGGGCRSG